MFRYLWKLLGLLHSFLSDRHQRVVLNSQSSNCSHIKTGVPQDSILRPLHFLVYFTDLLEGLTTSAKLFANDTSLFSVVYDSAVSSASLNDDLLKMSRWGYKWKMIFNPDAPNRFNRLFSLAKQRQVTTELFILTMYR